MKSVKLEDSITRRSPAKPAKGSQIGEHQDRESDEDVLPLHSPYESDEDDDDDLITAEEHRTLSSLRLMTHGMNFKNPMTIACTMIVIVFGVIANMSGKACFMLRSYPVRPSLIPPDTEPILFMDPHALVTSKHTLTCILCWCIYQYERWRFSKGKDGIFEHKKMYNKHKKLPTAMRINTILFCSAPALCDYGFSFVMSSAAQFVRASTSQMISNLTIALVALGSMIVFKKALTLGQMVGISIVFIGVFLSGLDGATVPDEKAVESNRALLGIGLVIAGTFLRSIATILESWMLATFPIHAVKLYAVEQGFTVVYCSFYYIITASIGSDSFRSSFWMMYNNQLLLFSAMTLALGAFLMNTSSLILSKLTNPIFRQLCISTRTPTTWLFEIMFGWALFNPIVCIGQVVIIGGILIYSGLGTYHLKLFRRPCTLHGRLEPTPEAVMTAKQIKRGYAKRQAVFGNRFETDGCSVSNYGVSFRSFNEPDHQDISNSSPVVVAVHTASPPKSVMRDYPEASHAYRTA